MGENPRQPIDWQSVLDSQGVPLSDEERLIVSLLAQGKTQPQIGRELSLHRSAVWRRIKALRKRLEASQIRTNVRLS